jgi:hypothetical protein
VSRKFLPPHLRRAVLASAAAAALLLVPLPASAGWAWNIGAGLGLASLVFALVLYLYPLRGNGVAHRRLFSLSQHRRIGWIALSLAGLHTALLLIAQPLVGRYLLPSAPIYMACGVAAFIALAVLVGTGISARSALKRLASPGDTRPSMAAHAVLAALLLGLLGAHIVGSGQLVDRPTKAITGCVLLALAILGSAWRSLPFRIGTKMFTTVIPGVLAAAALMLLPTATGGSRLLQPPLAPSLLHVNFPHENHTSVNCVLCHHNYVDKTGFGSCLDCHRSLRSDLIQAPEATFHVFCRDCHRKLALENKSKHGPVRKCSGCHVG